MISGKVLASLISGIATGAVLGMLFAPDKGTESRKKIYEKGDELMDELEKKFQDLNNDLKNKYKSAEKEVRQQAEELTDM
ncbi:MAG: YtxH domain-containing protein [Balneolaceae bacterium]